MTIRAGELVGLLTPIDRELYNAYLGGNAAYAQCQVIAGYLIKRGGRNLLAARRKSDTYIACQDIVSSRIDRIPHILTSIDPLSHLDRSYPHL